VRADVRCFCAAVQILQELCIVYGPTVISEEKVR